MDDRTGEPGARKEELSTKQRALIALEDMRGRLAAMERSRNEPIAVIGCSCRFPGGSTSVESYWRLLQEGRDGIREVPPGRWNVDEFYDAELSLPGTMNTRWGGFLEELDQFDPGFFGISVREASTLDPQQRLLLEVSWEALERAGYAADRLKGSMTGVFVGISSWDYANLLTEAPPRGGTGLALSIAANRLSYCFDFQGPSVALDTACSSSLVTVDLACQSLRSGVSDLALAGGVNVILSPWTTVAFSQAGMMAADGRCKTFDAAANGYVRSEGCGIIVLKRMSDALRDHDHILGVIRGSAVNHDGHSNGLTAPNGLSQQVLIRRALKNAGVTPQQVGYVETHGTGTPLGDAVEVDALWEVIREGRAGDTRCVLGSVKTNVGHLEAAAGVAGLIKTLLLLENEEIPPHLHLTQASPNLALSDKPGLTIATRSVPWRRSAQPRIAGVSSFGFGGTNAHVVVAEAPVRDVRPTQTERPAHLLTLSAKTPSALRALTGRYQAYLAGASGSLADICHTASVGRSHFEHRVAVPAASIEELWERLASQAVATASTSRTMDTAGPPRIAMLFGPGFHHVGARQTLVDTQPVFRRLLRACVDVSGTLSDGDADDVAIFAFQYALTRTLQSWGIQPAAVFGVGAGALAAACAADVFGWQDGVLLAGNPDAGRRIGVRSPSIPFVSADTGRILEPGVDPTIGRPSEVERRPWRPRWSRCARAGATSFSR
jgi:acyl transferase domain-containing protein